MELEAALARSDTLPDSRGDEGDSVGDLRGRKLASLSRIGRRIKAVHRFSGRSSGPLLRRSPSNDVASSLGARNGCGDRNSGSKSEIAAKNISVWSMMYGMFVILKVE